MGEVLETDRDQRQDNHSGRVACSPGQSAAAGRQGTIDGKRSHRHQVISPADHVNGSGGESGENADQQRFRFSVCEFCRSGLPQPLINVRRPTSTSD